MLLKVLALCCFCPNRYSSLDAYLSLCTVARHWDLLAFVRSSHFLHVSQAPTVDFYVATSALKLHMTQLASSGRCQLTSGWQAHMLDTHTRGLDYSMARPTPSRAEALGPGHIVCRDLLGHLCPDESLGRVCCLPARPGMSIYTASTANHLCLVRGGGMETLGCC